MCTLRGVWVAREQGEGSGVSVSLLLARWIGCSYVIDRIGDSPPWSGEYRCFVAHTMCRCRTIPKWRSCFRSSSSGGDTPMRQSTSLLSRTAPYGPWCTSIGSARDDIGSHSQGNLWFWCVPSAEDQLTTPPESRPPAIKLWEYPQAYLTLSAQAVYHCCCILFRSCC